MMAIVNMKSILLLITNVSILVQQNNPDHNINICPQQIYFSYLSTVSQHDWLSFYVTFEIDNSIDCKDSLATVASPKPNLKAFTGLDTINETLQ